MHSKSGCRFRMNLRSRKRMKALIVEDAREVVETITLLLNIRWPDCKVVATDQGSEALRLIETEAPDILLLDLGLPDQSGQDILREVRSISDVPIMVVTANQD